MPLGMNFGKVSCVILIFLLLKASTVRGAEKECSGKCFKDADACTKEGGKVDDSSSCTNQGVCCDLSTKTVGSCSAVINGSRTATFQSPLYPKSIRVLGGYSCQFKFVIGAQPHTGILIDFLDFVTEGVAFGQNPVCDTDFFFIQGLQDWNPPPRCGSLGGYSTLIPITDYNRGKVLKMIAVISSHQGVRWKVQISLVDSKSGSGSEPGQKAKTILTSPIIQALSGSDETNADIPNIEYPLIVNGENTSISEVPWQASLRNLFPDEMFSNKSEADFYNRPKPFCDVEGRHFCGGTIISDSHILTAAHCFSSKSKRTGWKFLKDVKVFVGETDLCNNDAENYGRKTQNLSIEKVIFHYGYNDHHVLHDMAVLKLKGKIQFNSYIKPIALIKRNKTIPGRTVLASGWGLTNLTAGNTPENSPPLILQSTQLIVENETYCSTHLVKGYGENKKIILQYPAYSDAFGSILCTFSNTSSTSKLVGQGDSGGPLVLHDTSVSPPLPTLIGVTSFGLTALESTANQHDNKYVQFFQDVSFYRDWIDLAMSL